MFGNVYNIIIEIEIEIEVETEKYTQEDEEYYAVFTREVN